jgi:signal transduction histidine kinase
MKELYLNWNLYKNTLIENQLILSVLVLIIVTYLIFFYVRRWLKAEIERKVNIERLHFQQNRLIAMGEMLENISHHWRQPLNNLSLLALNIQKSHQKGELTEDYLEEKIFSIEDTVEEMSQIIESFSDYLCPKKNPESFSVKVSINMAINMLSAMLKKQNITIEFNTKESIHYLGFKNELIQVLLIILNNAKNALLNNESLPNKRIFIELKKVEEEIIISIQDNSLGISEELLDKIFDPYFTTEHKTQGRGLGLYIAKRIIINDFNGNIHVKNNNGALFEITLNKRENYSM